MLALISAVMLPGLLAQRFYPLVLGAHAGIGVTGPTGASGGTGAGATGVVLFAAWR